MGKHKRFHGPSMTTHSYKYECLGGGRKDGVPFIRWKTRCRVCTLLFRQETPNPPDRDAILCVCDKCAKPGRPRSAKGYSAMRLRCAQLNWSRRNRPG